MKARETLDEAIDRVATQMTRGDESLHIDMRPAFAHALRRGRPAFAHALWRGKPVAVLAGVAALLLAVVIIRTPRVDERVADSSIAVSRVPTWSPLPAAVSDVRMQRGVEERAARTGRLREGRVVESERPSWGIPFIDAPAALDVAASATPTIGIEMVAVEAIDVEPLTIDAIDRDGTTSPKEH